MICQVQDSKQYLWCKTLSHADSLDWEIPQNTDEAYAFQEQDQDESERFDHLRPSVTAPSAHTVSCLDTSVPTPYEAYHSVQDRRQDHHDRVEVCVGVDCDALTCAPYSRVTKSEEDVYARWVEMEKAQHSVACRKEENEDMPNPAVCRQPKVLSPDSHCSKLPAAAMMGLQKKRQENIRVLRCAGDFVATAAHAEHMAECHRRGPTEDRKALWSIAHGGV
eukprot:gnl/MRDRNA2_/MRDRNA2_173336_c0_seq1.p1 gnl/MRDRNA2_/MRDRNA2_173336_c0~~gnl/MRDRNA2_/MRDRNA2_173336_c0_seq1.p1  ORF type:complete len:221 (+),score=42.35 gnl/MRDRNA2_/MRDRNA2_173336_c0_seq1:77-739(+)